MNANKLLTIGCIISIYVLLAIIFPCLRIPYGFLPEMETKRLNNVLEGISVSFLMGTFVFYLTVVLKNKIKRKKMKWKFNDLYRILSDAQIYIENEFGVRYDRFSVSVLEEYYTEEVQRTFCEKLSHGVLQIMPYESILSEEENDIIYDIQCRMVMDPIGMNCDDKIKEVYVKNIMQICEDVVKLTNLSAMEVRKK